MRLSKTFIPGHSRLSLVGAGAILLAIALGAWLILRSTCAAPSVTAPAVSEQVRPLVKDTTARQGDDAPAVEATAMPGTPTSVPIPVRTPTPIGSSGIIRVAVASSIAPIGASHSPATCDRLCAAAILQMGLAETLLRTSPGVGGLGWTLEPHLAIRYEFGPKLEHLDVWLRPEINVHGEGGSLTAADVAMTFNSANAYTNPDSYHGYAADLAEYMIDAEVLSPLRVRFRLRSLDTRLPGVADVGHGVGIVVGRGDDGLVLATGPYRVVGWEAEKFRTAAFRDHFGGSDPDVRAVEWVSMPSAAARVATVTAGSAEVVEVVAHQRTTAPRGYALRDGARRIVSISFAGNYWETYGAATADSLRRPRDSSKPWVGDPFDGDGAYSEDTQSMRSARIVREALARAIDRTALANDTLGGHATEAHLPFLSAQSSLHPPHLRWESGGGTIPRALVATTARQDGLSIPLWVGASELNVKLGEAVAGDWRRILGANVTLDRTAARGYGAELVARTADTPGMDACRWGGMASLPFDWPRGKSLSSFSAGAIGAGQELPYATRAYRLMRVERDGAQAERLAAEFHAATHHWANCVGVVEVPIGAMYNAAVVAIWPHAESDWALGGVSDLHLMRLHPGR